MAAGLTYFGTPCDNAHRKVKGGESTMLDRITIDPRQMNGQPCIRGTRLTVRRVLELLATYPTRTELYAEYPFVEEADIQQALAYAATYLEDRVADLETTEP